MLINSDRFKKGDLENWFSLYEDDISYSQLPVYRKHINITKDAIKKFIDSEKNYFVGISWGKDSVVLAHMFLNINPESRIIFVNQLDNANPHSKDVKDIFLKRFNPKNYLEISYTYKDSNESWFKKGKPNKWYKVLKEINKEYGCHVTGIRPDESGKREKRFKIFGMETIHSFAPFQYMNNQDIFSYLYEHDLPTHPNYAMTLGGTIDRYRVRVAAIGNQEGDGYGRLEWEKQYYPDVLNRISKTSNAKIKL